MSFVLKNPKGLFVEIHFRGLASIAVLQKAKEALALWPEGAEKKSASIGIEALSSLPQRTTHMYLSNGDPGFDPVKHQNYLTAKEKERNGVRMNYNEYSHNFTQYAPVQAHGWAQTGSAKGASQGVCDFASPEQCGWSHVALVEKNVEALNKLFASIDAQPIDAYALKGASSALKKSRELTFETMDSEQKLVSCESWLLYVGGRGYLDDKGNTGPLARARGFESAAAAKRTAGSRGLSAWKVVKSKLEVVSLEALPGDSEFTELGQAVSLQEAKSLKEMLALADVAALRAALAQAQERLGETEEQPKPAARSSRL